MLNLTLYIWTSWVIIDLLIVHLFAFSVKIIQVKLTKSLENDTITFQKAMFYFKYFRSIMPCQKKLKKCLNFELQATS